MKKYLITAALAAILVPTLASAQSDNGWAGEASLTGSKTTGNTETTDIGLGLKLAKEGEKWSHKFKALADYGESSGVNNKQRLALGYQIDRNISERMYVYGNADYFNDDFGAFKDGYFLGTGLGYKAVLPEPIGWNLEGGLGFRSQSEQEPSVITTEELALRGFSDFDYKFNDAVSLYNDTEIIYSSSDTYIWNEIGLTAQLMGNLAARASFRVDNHSNVPVGREKTDTITRFGVVYTLK
ncbi:MAG: DUF481 domain-containing protein [Acidimicrobiales bacterium]|nr:DUF481 domain-containing protein [Hyphomonadaceae bacterium]RZV40655.1 MAG: DUF481 domain-containing protein [Acidimicrobiales bacterium]